MVNVNKNIVPGKSAEKAEEKAPMRRPRNKALNSSKTTNSRIEATRKLALNSSKKVGEFEYETISLADLAARNDISEEELAKYVNFWKSQGHDVQKFWVCGEAPVGKDVLVETTDKTYLWDEDGDLVEAEVKDEDDLDSACSDKQDVDSACGDKSDLNSAADEKLDGTITLYDDFAKITEIDVEKLLKERVSKMVPGVDVSLEKINDTQIKVSGDCPEDEATRVKLAIESSDVTKSVDWDAKEAELDSSTKTTEKVEDDETAKDATEEVQKLNCSEEEEIEDKVVVTESGNEISIKEIKVVQNPSTNELALYVPENEDDEIPDGFVVLGDVVATAAAEAPEEEVKEEFEEKVEEEEPEEGELDSSKKKN